MNGCIIKDFKQGKVEIFYKVSSGTLDIKYLTSPNDDEPSRYTDCFIQQYEKVLSFQGFFGLTSANLNSSQNDIDLKMIDFFNLNSDYYQSVVGIEKRDYFAFERKKAAQLTNPDAISDPQS